MSDGFGKLQLAGVDPIEVFGPSGPRRRPPVGRGAEHSQVDLVDPDFRQLVPEQVHGKSGRRELGTARTSMTRSTPASFSAARNSATVVLAYRPLRLIPLSNLESQTARAVDQRERRG